MRKSFFSMLVVSGVLLFSLVRGQSQSYRVYVSDEYGGDVTVIDPADNSVVGSITISERLGDVRPRGLEVSPDGKTIYVAVSDFNPQGQTNEDAIVAIDAASNTVGTTYHFGSDPERLAVSPDGSQLWVADEDSSQATGFDVSTGETLGSFPHRRRAGGRSHFTRWGLCLRHGREQHTPSR